MRVAVAQFATSSNTQENLATCIRMIKEAAKCKPAIIVLPEYCNTQADQKNHQQAWDEALNLNGEFLQKIAALAKLHHCNIVLNVTLRRDLVRNEVNPLIKSNISITTCTFAETGELIHQADKQTLQAHESEFFINTKTVDSLFTSSLGKLSVLTGTEITSYKAREQSRQGAKLLCNLQSTKSQIQNSIYSAAWAHDNNVFIATASKISDCGSVKSNAINNEDSSQIVSLNGKILATLANDKEGVIFADIDLDKAGIEKYQRPDGTNFTSQHRPELYQQLVLTSKTPALETLKSKIPETVNVALFATYKSNEQAIEDVCYYIENNLSDIIQLPELFFLSDKTIANNAIQRVELEALCHEIITKISAVLRPFQYVCTSLVINGSHQAVLINENGIFAIQQQLHFCNRYQWTSLGNNLNIIVLPLEQGFINIAMLTADDANIPELSNIAALNNVNALLIPFDIQTSSEVNFGLLTRAAEHQICIVASSREKSFSEEQANNDIEKINPGNIKKIKPQKSTGLVVDIVNGNTNNLDGKLKIKQQHGKITKALIHPRETIQGIYT